MFQQQQNRPIPTLYADVTTEAMLLLFFDSVFDVALIVCGAVFCPFCDAHVRVVLCILSNYDIIVLRKRGCFTYYKYVLAVVFESHGRIQRGGVHVQGDRIPPEKSQVSISFVRNSGMDQRTNCFSWEVRTTLCEIR